MEAIGNRLLGGLRPIARLRGQGRHPGRLLWQHGGLIREIRGRDRDYFQGGNALRALITGIAGFAGSHLADYLLGLQGGADGVELCGIDLPREGPRQIAYRNIAHIAAHIDLRLVDLADYETARGILKEVRPDQIYHLAAQAAVGRSWANPTETLVNNISAQANLLHAVVALGLRPRILIVGSADEYGLVQPDELPIDEETPLRPMNPYAVSKIAQDFLGCQYHISHHLEIVRVRPFNHIGPRQGPGFVVPDFSQQIARIEAGLQEPVMRVGNLTAKRDFTDVRDVVRAYHLALTRGRAGQVYNIGSSRAYAIQEILDMLLSLSSAEVRVESDPARMRPSDVPVTVCDSSRLRADTGWQPTRTLEKSLRDVLDDWRERVRRNP